jgi:aromatic ring-opening dioxygenase catalytic subunit (LigB family)
LLLMHPQADVPVLQLSLTEDLEPARHIDLGRALAGLRSEGVMILGSGLSFHNMQAFRSRGNGAESEAFHDWLVDSLANNALSAEQRFERLTQWQHAPLARFCHPREEHLLPLHVCLGAAGGEAAQINFDEPVLGHRAIGALWL